MLRILGILMLATPLCSTCVPVSRCRGVPVSKCHSALLFLPSFRFLPSSLRSLSLQLASCFCFLSPLFLGLSRVSRSCVFCHRVKLSLSTVHMFIFNIHNIVNFDTKRSKSIVELLAFITLFCVLIILYFGFNI